MDATSMGMTPRERMLTAARGGRCDRVPLFYWLNPHGACRLIAEYRRAASRRQSLLAKALWKRFERTGDGRDSELSRLLPYKLLEYGNSEYVLHLGSDNAFKSMGNFKAYGQARKRIFREDGHIRFRDPFGAIRSLGGIYLDVTTAPVNDVCELEGYQFPDLSDASAIRYFRKKHPESCILVEVGGPQQITSQNIWNLEDYMLALYDHPDAIGTFHRRVADWSLGIAEKAVRAGADMVFIGDDYGMNGAPLMSMDLWKKLTYPHLKHMIEQIHRMGVPVMLHSCGYQMPFLDSYVDAGLDVLQSFQPMAGNEFETAYREYGDRITFATGIDTQQGERMSPSAFREDILRYHELAAGGGFMLAMTHMLQYTMPLRNIEVMFSTIREITCNLTSLGRRALETLS